MQKSNKVGFYLIFLISLFFLISCSSSIHYSQPRFPYPQAPGHYLRNYDAGTLLISSAYQEELYASFKQKMFRPWCEDTLTHTVRQAYWAAAFIMSAQGYGENKLPHRDQWVQQLIINADSLHYGENSWLGMNTVRSSLRALPTHHPFYLDFNKAGEGFPFDYLQNSALPVNTPLRVLNQSLDKAWLLVDSHHAMGWVPAPEICRLDTNVQKIRIHSSYITPVKEPVAVLDSSGHFLFQAMIGAVFPLIDSTKTHWIVEAVLSSGRMYGEIRCGYIKRTQAVIMPWLLTMCHASKLTEEFLRQPYGWGGLFKNRDCSAMIKDFYTPFGIWLPRHSSAQAALTPFQVDLLHLHAGDKRKAIVGHGVPYLSLIWRPGHIMLYAGQYNKQPMIFHNLWGLKTKSLFGREGRHIIGQAVLTTLTPGKDLNTSRRKGSLLEGIARITSVVHPDSVLTSE
ncbi:SH3 domain-containing protein [bacterium]|nr:SH3 domain-containing protein [bacterium]